MSRNFDSKRAGIRSAFVYTDRFSTRNRCGESNFDFDARVASSKHDRLERSRVVWAQTVRLDTCNSYRLIADRWDVLFRTVLRGVRAVIFYVNTERHCAHRVAEIYRWTTERKCNSARANWCLPTSSVYYSTGVMWIFTTTVSSVTQYLRPNNSNKSAFYLKVLLQIKNIIHFWLLNYDNKTVINYRTRFVSSDRFNVYWYAALGII